MLNILKCVVTRLEVKTDKDRAKQEAFQCGRYEFLFDSRSSDFFVVSVKSYLQHLPRTTKIMILANKRHSYCY